MSVITEDKLNLWFDGASRTVVQAGIIDAISKADLSTVSLKVAMLLGDIIAKSSMLPNQATIEELQIKLFGGGKAPEQSLPFNCAKIFSYNLANTQAIYNQYNALKNITSFLDEIAATTAISTYNSAPFARPLFLDSDNANVRTMNPKFLNTYCNFGVKNSTYASKIDFGFSAITNTTILNNLTSFNTYWGDICYNLNLGNNNETAKDEIDNKKSAISGINTLLVDALLSQEQNTAWKTTISKLPFLYIGCRNQSVVVSDGEINTNPSQFYGRELKLSLEANPVNLNSVENNFNIILNNARGELASDSEYYQQFCNTNAAIADSDNFCSIII
jgi:hypothetical protein